MSLLAGSTEAPAEFLTACARRVMTQIHRMFPDLRGALIAETTNNRE